MTHVFFHQFTPKRKNIRFLDQFSSTRLLSLHAISLLSDFRYFYTNTDEKFTQPQILRNIETLYGPYIYKGVYQK